MSTTSTELGLIAPEDADSADVPAYVTQLRDQLEAIIANGHAKAWSPGDFKVSAQTASHGRWLLCDGRELTQAQIESELGLAAGKGAPIVALLGLAGASVYGAAAAGKVKLPDPRGRMVMGAGSGAGLTARARGAAGGAESVTLTGPQSGVKQHNHTGSVAAHNHPVTDPGHSHGDGTLGTDAAANHQHSDGTLATDTAAGHTHSADGTLVTDTVADHQHGPGTLATNTEAAHSHSADGTLATSISGAAHTHSPAVAGYRGILFGALASGSSNRLLVETGSGGTVPDSGSSGYGDLHSHDVTGNTSSAGSHAHNVTGGSSGLAGSHNHDVSGNTSSGGSHSHDVSGATGLAGGHSHDVTGSTGSAGTGITTGNTTPAVTINNVGDTDASEAHPNMPPYLALGNVFIRV